MRAFKLGAKLSLFLKNQYLCGDKGLSHGKLLLKKLKKKMFARTRTTTSSNLL